jgi:hypothetical protein
MSTENNWIQLRNNIKSCDLCDGLNSEKLGTDNAPGYGNINSTVVLYYTFFFYYLFPQIVSPPIGPIINKTRSVLN